MGCLYCYYKKKGRAWSGETEHEAGVNRLEQERKVGKEEQRKERKDAPES